ncbi:MAG: cache domain-containing protein, partial [Arcobacteraceae bacterium]
MLINKDEKRLLLSIKIIPMVLLCVVAVVGILIVLYVNKVTYDNEINKVTTEYLLNEKQLIYKEVTKIRDDIVREKQLTETKLQESIKNYLYTAYSVVDNIYKQNKNKSNKEIIKMIKDALRDVRFNENRGYFFMYEMDGTVLLLPTNEELEGKNLLDFKDAKGTLSIRNMRDKIRENKESFFTWWWYKPNEEHSQSKKIGFGKYFEPLDLFIGTGEYVEDFEESVKKTITKRLSQYTYGKNYYIFIYDQNGKLIAHKNKDLIGTTSFVFEGIKNKTLKKVFYDFAEETGSFYQYTFSKYNTTIKDKENKISYILPFEDWNWHIASGFYTDDLNTIINATKKKLTIQKDKKIKNIIIICIFLMVIVILLSLLVSSFIKQRFESYNEKVKEKDQMLFQQSKMAAMGEMIENIA